MELKKHEFLNIFALFPTQGSELGYLKDFYVYMSSHSSVLIITCNAFLIFQLPIMLTSYGMMTNLKYYAVVVVTDLW